MGLSAPGKPLDSFEIPGNFFFKKKYSTIFKVTTIISMNPDAIDSQKFVKKERRSEARTVN